MTCPKPVIIVICLLTVNFYLQVTVDCIRREKGLYSQAKVRLYLRYCMQFDEDEGIWVVKVTFVDVFT